MYGSVRHTLTEDSGWGEAEEGGCGSGRRTLAEGGRATWVGNPPRTLVSLVVYIFCLLASAHCLSHQQPHLRSQLLVPPLCCPPFTAALPSLLDSLPCTAGLLVSHPLLDPVLTWGSK